jgi:hypothetical protein
LIERFELGKEKKRLKIFSALNAMGYIYRKGFVNLVTDWVKTRATWNPNLKCVEFTFTRAPLGHATMGGAYSLRYFSSMIRGG